MKFCPECGKPFDEEIEEKSNTSNHGNISPFGYAMAGMLDPSEYDKTKHIQQAISRYMEANRPYDLAPSIQHYIQKENIPKEEVIAFLQKKIDLQLESQLQKVIEELSKN